MEDAGRREVDVQAVPHVAHEGTEEPLPGQLHRCIERHRTERHEHVGQC